MTGKTPGIRQRSPGTYQITVYSRRLDADGKYQRVIETIRGTKRQAEQRRAELMADVAAGRYQKPVRETVGNFFTRWLASASTSLASQTVLRYRSSLRHHIIPYIGDIPIGQLDAGHIVFLMSKLEEKNLGGPSKFAVFSVLHRGLSQAKRWKLIQSNPSDDVDKPRTRNRAIVVLTNEQTQNLIECIDEHRFRIGFRIMVHTGIRVGELRALRWKDIDLEHGWMMVSQQYTQDKKFTPTKGGRPPRKINIDTTLIAMLRTHKANQNKIRLAVGAEWQKLDLVFCDDKGAPVDYQALYKSFTLVCAKAGLVEGFRMHDLRHNHASALLAQGTDIKVVQERLGHASPMMTLTVYGHQMPGRQEEAAQRFADTIGFSSSPKLVSGEDVL